MIRAFRLVYLGLAWLFVAGVTVQVFLAGLVVVAGLVGWDYHIGLGHSLGVPLLLMLVSMYVGRLPRSFKWLTWLLFAVYVLQADVVIFLRSQLPVVSALHPVFALADFALGLSLAQRASSAAREKYPTTGIEPQRAATGR
ncbi:MAG TPA: DUF6220 domain-containing protein [Anaerolineae bacterium]